MDYEIEIIELEWGFGYRVGGVYQEYHPDNAGFVPMSRDEAQACAEQVLSRLIL